MQPHQKLGLEHKYLCQTMYMQTINISSNDLSKEEQRKLYRKEYYLRTREKTREKNREKSKVYYQQNKHKWNTLEAQHRRISHRERTKEIRAKYQKEYYENNKEKKTEYDKQYYQKNKEKGRENSRRYYQRSKEKVKEYKLANKERFNARRRERREKDITWRLKTNLRTRLIAILGRKKSISALNLVGCTVNELREHIEKQWQPGMNWDNHTKTGWHIDHIKPVNTFDLTDIEQQRKCFHYSNLRPLWAKDNLSRPKNGLDIN